MIEITTYEIPLNVRISQEEYDKIMDSELTKSDFVRFAIDSYDVKSKRNIELSRKELIENILEHVVSQQNTFKKEILEQINLQEANIQSHIKALQHDCNIRLNEIEEEIKNSEVHKNKRKELSPDEEKIYQILPTLQRIYNSEYGLTYSKIRFQAARININPVKLKHWVADNQQILLGEKSMKK